MVQSPVGSLLLSSESWCMEGFVYALQDWSLFPPVLWKSCNQISLAFKVRFPGDSQPQAGKTDVGFRTFTTVGELLWYYFSPVCGSPTHQEWDLILLWLCPFYCLSVASSLSSYVRRLFWGKVPASSCRWLFNGWL